MTRSTSTHRRPASTYATPLDRLLWEQIQERSFTSFLGEPSDPFEGPLPGSLSRASLAREGWLP